MDEFKRKRQEAATAVFGLMYKETEEEEKNWVKAMAELEDEAGGFPGVTGGSKSKHYFHLFICSIILFPFWKIYCLDFLLVVLQVLFTKNYGAKEYQADATDCIIG